MEPLAAYVVTDVEAHVLGLVGSDLLARRDGQVAERGARLDVAVGVGRPALDQVAVRGHQVAIAVQVQRPGLGVKGLVACLGDEEAVALDRQVEGVPCLFRSALGEVGFDPGDLYAQPDLGGVDAAVCVRRRGRTGLGLAEQVLELDLVALVPRRVDVGDVVTDGVNPFLVGVHTGDSAE